MKNNRYSLYLNKNVKGLSFLKAKHFYKNKNVLITGGAGSIGSVLVKKISLMEVKSLSVIDNSELNIFKLENELNQISNKKLNKIKIYYGDIRSVDSLKNIKNQKYDIIIHTAALKHVPIVEKNKKEAITTNLLGLTNVLDCFANNKTFFIFVSTDKAVNPKNFMGMTKFFGEILVRSFFKNKNYSIVRFGNVIGSKGSAIPLFEKQINMDKIVTITDRSASRLFMTLLEASYIILNSYHLQLSLKNHITFIYKMGNPYLILDIVKRIIKYYDAKNVKIIEIGLREGEKQHEEILYKFETLKSSGSKFIDYTEFKDIDKVPSYNQNKKFIKDLINTNDPKKKLSKLISNFNQS